MDHWRKCLKLWMEDDLKRGFLALPLSHLDAMKACWSTEDLYGSLSSHTILDIPTLHYLARFLFREEDVPRLNKLIKIFTDFGYDINKTTGRSWKAGLNVCGFSALFAAIDHKNPVLMECLLRHGARIDIRNENGLSACHFAVKVGDLRCLEKLVQFGGPSVLAITSILKSGEEYIRPLLHMAVEEGHTEIVSYLLRKWEEFGVNVNKKTLYKKCTFLNDPTPVLESLTPLELAIHRRNIPIVRVLLKHPPIKLSDFKALHLCLEKGVTEAALLFLEVFSADDLISDKDGGRWALHRLHPKAFYKNSKVEYTRKLILEYVRRGWDINSVSASTISPEIVKMYILLTLGNLTRYTLLHLACLYKGKLEVIQMLIEAGADINSKTEGDLEFTPLLISLTMKRWQTAAYLIEKGADLGVRGSFKNNDLLTRVIRKKLTTGNLEPDESLNAVELLVSMGREEGLPLLDQILVRSDVVWHGANEFHLAVQGAHPVYISKVLENCAKLISKEDLSWMTVRPTRRQPLEKVPTLLYVLSILRNTNFVNVPALANLIKLLVSFGYDLNLFRRHQIDGWIITEITISHALAIDFSQDSSNLLLKTILQNDHLQLSLDHGTNPAERALRHWTHLCSSGRRDCWKNKPLSPPSVDAIKLLISHGLDVTRIVIDSNFIYHFGYNAILKMLYCAGAQISEEFFTSPRVCHPEHPETEGFLQEIAEVKQWKEEFDRTEGSSMKHACRLRVRKMVKCVGDLKMLDGIPEKLKDYALCKTYF